jgi:hypothetical protein
MDLLLRRSQRDDGWMWSSITFILYAQLDLDEEERHLLKQYALHDRVVYNSADFLHHLKAADEYRETAAKTPDDDPLTIAYNSFAALAHNILGKFYLQLTLQNLIEGVRIESDDLEEISTVANLIQKAVAFLSQYYDIAATFDGREDLDEL